MRPCQDHLIHDFDYQVAADLTCLYACKPLGFQLHRMTLYSQQLFMERTVSTIEQHGIQCHAFGDACVLMFLGLMIVSLKSVHVDVLFSG